MSGDGEIEPTSRRAPTRRMSPALVGGAVLGAALAAFVAQNTEDIEVTWLFFDVSAPLWLVLLVTVAVALVLGELIAAGMRRRRRVTRRGKQRPTDRPG